MSKETLIILVGLILAGFAGALTGSLLTDFPADRPPKLDVSPLRGPEENRSFHD